MVLKLHACALFGVVCIELSVARDVLYVVCDVNSVACNADQLCT